MDEAELPMTSLWLDTAPSAPSTDRVEDGHAADVVVVGAGLTGLTTGLLLARAGLSVVVVEARHIGAVATGNTTAKLSLLQGTKLSQISRHHSRSVMRAYVEANREGQAWLLQFCLDHDIAHQVRDAVTYAPEGKNLPALRDEQAVARDAGLEVQWRDRFDVPFPHAGGIVLPEQAQFHPMEVLAGLADQLRQHGGLIHEGSRVVEVSHRGEATVRLDSGATLRAGDVVVATGTPFLDRGLYFAKVEPHRSYALAYDWPGTAAGPIDMYLAAGSPTRSVRDAPLPGGTKLLVGGSGHVVGRTGSESEHLDALRAWTALYFPDTVATHAWSAQDYSTADGVPFVGRMPRGGGRIYVATGYDKWGMTNAVAAARTISSLILGEKPSWAKVLGRRISTPGTAASLVSTNSKVVAAQVVAGLDTALSPMPANPPAEGCGEVVRAGVVPTGISTVDGQTCAVVALCTHLGGVLRWNDAEKSWDCPLHGSRFTPAGDVLEGPATTPLRPRSPE